MSVQAAWFEVCKANESKRGKEKASDAFVRALEEEYDNIRIYWMDSGAHVYWSSYRGSKAKERGYFRAFYYDEPL